MKAFTFTRGLDPKVAMGTGMKRCKYCNKAIALEEQDACNDCLEERYSITERHSKITGTDIILLVISLISFTLLYHFI